jgi:hypothetical protein
MHTCVRGIDCFSVSMISFIIIIIINVHVPDQYSERSCIHGSEVSIVSVSMISFIIIIIITLIIIIIKDIIETETIDTSDP